MAARGPLGQKRTSLAKRGSSISVLTTEILAGMNSPGLLRTQEERTHTVCNWYLDYHQRMPPVRAT